MKPQFFFDLLEKLPPIEGPRVAKLANQLAETDCTLESLNQTFLQRRQESKNEPEPKQDQWGFVKLPAVDSETGDEIEISCDIKSSQRNCMDLSVNIFVQLIKIYDPAVRVLLAQDCSKIVDLRLSFDLS